MFWLSKFKKGDRTDPLFLSRLFDTFLNAVYLYDDGRLRICINTLSEETTVTFQELSEALTGSDIEPSGRLYGSHPNFLPLRKGRVVLVTVEL